MLKNFITAVGCTVLVSCATGDYSSSGAENYGTFVVRSVSDDVPRVDIVVGGKPYSFPSQSIAKPYATAKPQQKYRVEAGKHVLIRFTHHWIGEEVIYPRTHASGSAEFVKIEKSKGIDSCSTSVAFVPEREVQYTVYFKHVTDKCSSWVEAY